MLRIQSWKWASSELKFVEYALLVLYILFIFIVLKVRTQIFVTASSTYILNAEYQTVILCNGGL